MPASLAPAAPGRRTPCACRCGRSPAKPAPRSGSECSSPFKSNDETRHSASTDPLVDNHPEAGAEHDLQPALTGSRARWRPARRRFTGNDRLRKTHSLSVRAKASFPHQPPPGGLRRGHMTVYDAPLPDSFGKELRGALGKPNAGIRGDEPDALQPAVLEMLEECAPASLVLLRPLANAEDVPIAALIHADRNQQRDVAHLASPAALEHDAVEVNIRVLALDRPVAPGFDRCVDLLVQVRRGQGRHPRAPRASVMSSTRRTDTPAIYILISASSTELSRHR